MTLWVWYPLLLFNLLFKPMLVARYYLSEITDPINQFKLIGFCDVSSKAYAAVVYLCLVSNRRNHLRILGSKTRVAPITQNTIPRLELLAALLLTRLVMSITGALQMEIPLEQLTCFTDSKVALYWICGWTKEWKQFGQDRVDEIRSLLPTECWRHCPGVSNPADVPTRGSRPSDLIDNTLWWNGLELIIRDEVSAEQLPIPDECLNEMKSS